MVGCEQFEPIELKTLDFKFEPIHQADVLHTDELDKNKSVVYRNMSDTGLGNHSYKHASIGSTDLFIELYYLYGKVINDILSHNDRVEEYKKKKELEENNVKTLK